MAVTVVTLCQSSQVITLHGATAFTHTHTHTHTHTRTHARTHARAHTHTHTHTHIHTHARKLMLPKQAVPGLQEAYKPESHIPFLLTPSTCSAKAECSVIKPYIELVHVQTNEVRLIVSESRKLVSRCDIRHCQMGHPVTNVPHCPGLQITFGEHLTCSHAFLSCIPLQLPIRQQH